MKVEARQAGLGRHRVELVDRPLVALRIAALDLPIVDGLISSDTLPGVGGVVSVLAPNSTQALSPEFTGYSNWVMGLAALMITLVVVVVAAVAGHQAALAKRLGGLVIEPVHLLGLIAFLRKIERIGCRDPEQLALEDEDHSTADLGGGHCHIGIPELRS